MPHPPSQAVHCINPDCPRPYPQTWGNNFCQSCGTPLRLKNRYIPLQGLGTGGFAAIYTVWDAETQTERVLKLLLETSPKALKLFEQEAWVLAILRHPGVPRVEPDGYFHVQTQNLGGGDGNATGRRLPCLVMEKIHGKTLEEILEDHPQGCPQEWVFSWLSQAVQILEELHRCQIIHRDIKPSNLMLRDPESPQVLLSKGLGGLQLVTIDFGGVKQMGGVEPMGKDSASSTRLISPGYSPPEQIVGGQVVPATDFYALGRTCIHLLTGKYPAEIEDPMTGELRWRHIVSVSPAFANLLDDMVRSNIQQRPASAADVRSRLQDIYAKSKGKIALAPVSQAIVEFCRQVVVATAQKTASLTVLVFGAIAQLVVASLDTGWEMVLGGVGGSAGAIGGLVLAYASPIGPEFASFLNEGLHQLIPYMSFNVGPEVLLFAFAGWGTAIGLTDAGSFRQQKQYWLSGLMGAQGYLLASLCWMEATAFSGVQGIILGAFAIATLTIGMGLRSHQLAHALVVAACSTGMFLFLNALSIFPGSFLGILDLSSGYPFGWLQIGSSIAFFGLLGSAIGLCLGVSHYLVVPVLRWLGWR
ncbi:MAG: serine/threonine protein kinase [Microcoleus sp. PH2017_25_DOB_D_A]|uniref:serine/threonine protein kinase n=1 Tax=unclassified Microcoleus TaxID=2642155 RepID=UPI001D60E120|nr:MULTISPECIES: serine/threonine-protein kinase [unclassified Microcoleus]TAE13541.1 MAG: serine/threonine protein kinase [Oscillatoriales cyanobacterium]MCC3472336.1 serine/threonine protein kinase [Microcoleus sp. PH2017_13_LAR_U_A]MCC3484877.1 serine/threonine protein kinase [Microcoleus sp. PH2017_14_LAR_D_A]MCC3496824.1 serine/threonine protein kinase [Microcoleus sp. PH2017_15_JOR_U_A]MCC3534386.1 serine/threonine protein kinase [Microcoleus sp. PH2017_25_DOB_D_A]